MKITFPGSVSLCAFTVAVLVRSTSHRRVRATQEPGGEGREGGTSRGGTLARPKARRDELRCSRRVRGGAPRRGAAGAETEDAARPDAEAEAQVKAAARAERVRELCRELVSVERESECRRVVFGPLSERIMAKLPPRLSSFATTVDFVRRDGRISTREVLLGGEEMRTEKDSEPPPHKTNCQRAKIRSKFPTCSTKNN